MSKQSAMLPPGTGQAHLGPARYAEPAPGKRAKLFYWNATIGAYIAAPAQLYTAFPPGSLNYDDKIELLVCKRIDMTDAEFEALPVVDSMRRHPRAEQ